MSKDSAAPSVAQAQVALAAVLFSTGGAAVKFAAIDGMPIAGLRSGIAVLFFAVVMPRVLRHFTKESWLVAVSYAGTLIAFVLANRMTFAMHAVFLQATAPLWVWLLGPALLGERMRRGDVFRLLLMGGGMALIFWGTPTPMGTAPRPLLGNGFALLAGFLYALTLIGLRWLATRSKNSAGADSATAAAVAGNIVAFAVCLPWIANSWTLGSTDWAAVTYLGVFQVGLAYLLLTKGMSRVTAFRTALLLLLEPALSPVWAWLLHGEPLPVGAIAGGVMVLFAGLQRGR